MTDSLQHTQIQGSRVRYLRVGRGVPIVLLHTLRTQLDYFFPLLEELDKSKLEVIAPDLPGHGESDAPPAAYSADYFTDAVAEFLEACDVRQAVVVGESIGATIALLLAARRNPRLARVVALNPYDYGRWGGIRRSSGLANLLFTAMLWPGVGALVASSGSKGILRRVLAGGLHDPSRLEDELVDTLLRCGARPGHARAFRSLCLNWRSWLAARERYGTIEVPVTLVYGQHDWSRPADRDANARDIPNARPVFLANCGHFSCLDRPEAAAGLIVEGRS